MTSDLGFVYRSPAGQVPKVVALVQVRQKALVARVTLGSTRPRARAGRAETEGRWGSRAWGAEARARYLEPTGSGPESGESCPAGAVEVGLMAA